MKDINSSLPTEQLNISESDGPSAEDLCQLASDFEALLSKEHGLLVSGDADQLREISDRKIQLVETLSCLQANYAQMIGRQNPDTQKSNTQGQEIREILERCKHQNSDNQILAQTVMRHTHKSVELIRSLQEMNDLYLYESNGSLDIRREQRHLGDA